MQKPSRRRWRKNGDPAFQIAHVDLDTTAAEQVVAYYDHVLGATPAERGSDGQTYFTSVSIVTTSPSSLRDQFAIARRCSFPAATYLTIVRGALTLGRCLNWRLADAALIEH
jgi:hypothetical protein